MNQQSDRPFLEVALESAEVLVDIAIKGEVLADLPVIGTALKLLKAKDTYRDSAFAAKLQKFVLALNESGITAREKMRAKIQAEPQEAQYVGETLFLVLDNLTDLSKAHILGFVFVAYLNDEVSSFELRRLAQAINLSFSDDLRELLEKKEAPPQSREPWTQGLASTGLTESLTGDIRFDGSTKTFYVVTDLGRLLCKAYFSGRQS